MRTPCRSAVAASPSVVARQTTRTSCPRATSRDDCSQSIRVPPPSAGVGETSETMRTRSFALTRRSPERPYAPRLQVLSDPELRHHQRPEAIGVCSRPREVLGLEALDRRRLEEPARSDLVGRKKLFQRAAQVGLEPIPQRDHEPLLPVGEHRRGQDLGERRLEESLQPQPRSEEHTSELQSPCNLVCRLLLEKKKKIRVK